MIKLTFVGDIICEEEQRIAHLKNDTYDFSNIFDNVKNTFNNSDFVVGNLETPIAGKDLIYTNHKWSFNSPIEFALSVKNAGFNLVSTANNHVLDRGIDGLINTIKNLDKIGLKHTGTQLEKNEKKHLIKTIDNLKVSFVAYSYGTNATFNKFYLNNSNKHAVNLFRKQERNITRFDLWKRLTNKIENFIIGKYTTSLYLIELIKEINQLKNQSDLVIVLMHSGGQYNLIPDNWTKKLMSFLLKNQVDVIVGCHPHVVQEVFFNKNKIGAFSLGNFCSYPGSESCKTNESEYSIILHIYIDEIEKKMKKATFQIAKSKIDSEGRSNVYLINDLIQNEELEVSKLKLIEDNQLIYNRFLNRNIQNLEIKSEYLICEFSSN